MDNLTKFIETLHEQLLAHSFQEVKDTNGNKISGLYMRIENPVLYILGVFDQENETNAHILETFAKQRAVELEEIRCNHLIRLCICLSEDDAEVPAPFYIDERIHAVNWRYSLKEKKVFAQKGQPNRLLGIEKLLLLASKGEKVQMPLEPKVKSGKPWVSISIFALCLLLLIYTTFSGKGGSTIRAFGLSRSGILEGEYYRFFTSMFLHSGIAHLVSNSIFLYYFGFKAEYLLGRGRFLTLYLLSGLMGGIFSVVFHDALAIGASGAIYGLLGAMLILTKKYGSKYTQMNYTTMLLLAFASISFGFLDMGVDNFAHIGGFLGGILVFLCYMKNHRKTG